ncbi:unnamed protein product [Lactuca saligna]|uniref:AN1-type domain-containing protein n=1 Tax=Lactuca saligna TaxID=75948 RepID=A0AA35VJ09_LACSI|nr:unnamed protein product [Lactuca saligna]
MNMCSKCHKNIILNQNQAKLTASIINGDSTSTNPTTIPLHPQPPSEVEAVVAQPSTVPPPPSAGPSRCTACRKRIGLTGFSCRCGNVFCSVHRYADKHECSIDYRAIGKDAIAKANPIVKAEKLDKI